ncbi:MAG: hypothetical protein ACOCW1_04225 [Chitinispirillaceae bacterium]
MTKNRITMIVFGVALMAFQVWGQEGSASSEQDAEEIYNSMLQTMSTDMKSRIDSASAMQKTKPASAPQTDADFRDGGDSAGNTPSGSFGIDKLPEELREKVRKTMETIEQNQKERMIEFKENGNRGKHN